MPRIELLHRDLTHSIIGAFYEVYSTLDFGFLEHVYKAALEKELGVRGHHVEREVRVVVRYKGEPIAVQVVDMIVDGEVAVGAKSSADVRPAWGRQLHSYLRGTHLQVGLLLHFGLAPKFYRVVELHSRKVRKSERGTNSTVLTDSADRSSAGATSLATCDEKEGK